MNVLNSQPNKILFLLLVLMTSAQIALCQDDKPRLSYWRSGGFYETGNANTSDRGKSKVGNAVGIEINVNPVYEGADNGEKLVLGWSLNGTFGFNFTKKQLRPVSLDLGVWSAYQLNDDIEFGLQYCFLGVYGFQNTQFAGSKLSPAVKFKNFQLTFARSGDGFIRGCFVPRFDNNAIHSAEFAYYVKKFIIGTRLNHYKFGYTTTDEFRIFFAVNQGS
jgi:hypothetical protein